MPWISSANGTASAWLRAAFQGYGEDANFKRIEPLKAVSHAARAYDRRTGLRFQPTGRSKAGSLRWSDHAVRCARAVAGANADRQAAMNLALSGTSDNPVFGGTASLKDATYEHIGAGVLRRSSQFRRQGPSSPPSGYVSRVDVTASDGTKHAAGEVPIKANGVMSSGQRRAADRCFGCARQEPRRAQRSVAGVASGKARSHGDLAQSRGHGSDHASIARDQYSGSHCRRALSEVKVVNVDAQGKPIAPEALPAGRAVERADQDYARCRIKRAGECLIRAAVLIPSGAAISSSAGTGSRRRSPAR